MNEISLRTLQQGYANATHQPETLAPIARRQLDQLAGLIVQYFTQSPPHPRAGPWAGFQSLDYGGNERICLPRDREHEASRHAEQRYLRRAVSKRVAENPAAPQLSAISSADAISYLPRARILTTVPGNQSATSDCNEPLQQKVEQFVTSQKSLLESRWALLLQRLAESGCDANEAFSADIHATAARTADGRILLAAHLTPWTFDASLSQQIGTFVPHLFPSLPGLTARQSNNAIVLELLITPATKAL